MSILDQIFETKHQEVALAKASTPLADLQAVCRDLPPTRGFLAALQGHDDLALIAEIKKASPSKGVIRSPFDPTEIALSYERAGANALSVLTDEHYFQGSAENLRLARLATHLPILRKDFIDDPYQVYQARAWGADAVLLIVAALDRGQIEHLHGLANDMEMDVLVEVHTEEEASLATDLGCALVGVNNRNLLDFKTDLENSERILPTLVNARIRVSESALESRADLDRVRKAGANAVLIGTTFCASADIEAKVHEVLGR